MSGSYQFISFCIIVLGALLIIYGERKFPYVKGQKLFRKGFFEDFVLYTVIQSYIAGLIIASIINSLQKYSIFRDVSFFTNTAIWIQCILFFLIHDFYIYWFHRLQHKLPILWRIHEAHHSSHEVDWLSGSRSHIIEILINQTVEFAPIILLGAAPEVALFKGTIDAVWGMYIHSNINVKSGKLQYFFNGPEMHRWHHANEDEAIDKNFSTKLAIWDWMFGTAYFPKNRQPRKYGLTKNYPQTFIGQLFHVFRYRQ